MKGSGGDESILIVRKESLIFCLIYEKIPNCGKHFFLYRKKN